MTVFSELMFSMLSYTLLWMLHGRHLLVTAGVHEGLGGRERGEGWDIGEGVRTGLNG